MSSASYIPHRLTDSLMNAQEDPAHGTQMSDGDSEALARLQHLLKAGCPLLILRTFGLQAQSGRDAALAGAGKL